MPDPTRQRILDAAERLFAERGVAATSLRTIMRSAGANMAAIHYHFGSRDGLLEAMIARRVEPVNRRRLEMLDDVERRFPRGPIPAEEVTRAFYLPALELFGDPERCHVARLMGRVIMEANGPEALERVFGPTLRRFVAAVRRAAPHLSENEARLRMHLAVGSMVFAVSVPRFAAQVPQRLDDLRGTVDQLVNFAAAGLVAPSVSPARKETP